MHEKQVKTLNLPVSGNPTGRKEVEFPWGGNSRAWAHQLKRPSCAFQSVVPQTQAKYEKKNSLAKLHK